MFALAAHENGAGQATDAVSALADPSVEPAPTRVADPRFSYVRLERRGKARNLSGAERFDFAAVKQWLAEGYNLGVRTGAQSRIWVLDVDVDVRTLEHSPEWLALLEEHGALPKTFTVRSPSGGLHYYFWLPDFPIHDDTNGTAIAPKVDIKTANDSYVVAPGMFASYDKHGVHFDGEYVVIDDSQIGHAPDWLLDRLRSREEKRAERASVPTMAPAPKADVIDPEHDQMARSELNDLFAMVDRFAALPEGESMEIFGAPRTWETGGGFYVLACKIIEVARWPHTAVTVEDAQHAWAARVPAKYATHDWANALASAGNSWEFGDRQINTGWDLLTEGVRQTAGKSGDNGRLLESGDKATETKQDERADDPLFRKSKNGGYAINSIVFRDYLFNGRDGVEFPPLAVDIGGSIWVYSDGVYTLQKSALSARAQTLLGDFYTPGAKVLARDLIVDSGEASVIDFNEAQHPDLINFQNGMLDWKTGLLHDHDPAVLSTAQVTFPWEPEADCPKFSAYVDRMLAPEAATLLWQVIGYTLLSGNPMQVVVYFVGQGGNGKGVVLRALTEMLGAHNVSSLTLAEIDGENRFKLSALVGKAANISGETTGGYIKESVNLKRASGNDYLDMERKGQDGFQAKVPATLIFSINETPHFGDDSDGLMQRGVVIPFDRKVSENHIDGFSENAFVAEFPGIARRGMDALRSVRMDSPDQRAQAFALVRDAQDKFEQDTNAELYWLSNHVRPKGGHFATPHELWRAFGGKSPRASRKFIRTLKGLFGEPLRRTPSSLAAIDPSKSRRQDCYEVEFSEDPYRVQAVIDDTFGEGAAS